MTDEQQIRDLIATWMRASAAADIQTVLQLMDEDVVYLIPGQPPMRGRDKFAAGFEASIGRYHMDGKSDIQEIQVDGNLAYCWTKLAVTVTPLPAGAPSTRSGNTLSVLRKNAAGRWLLWRDANLLTLDK